MTEPKQRGMRWRSRTFPRSAREVRVALSNDRNLRQTKEREFRVRTSETKEKIMERITSGRSLIVVAAAVIIAISLCA